MPCCAGLSKPIDAAGPETQRKRNQMTSTIGNHASAEISPWFSLKTRVTLLTLCIFLFGIWALAFDTSRLLQEDMKRILGEQLFQAADLLATDLNEELSDRLTSLELIAKDIDAPMLDNPAVLQTLLEQRPLLHVLFNGGVFATGINGTAIADVPVSAGRIGTNYLDRESVSGPLKTGKTVIGRPAMGKKPGAPIFSIVAPIRDGAGAVIGTLVGTINLGKPNFLDKITQGRYGKTGGYLLIAPQHRLIVTASDKSRTISRFRHRVSTPCTTATWRVMKASVWPSVRVAWKNSMPPKP